MTPERWSEIEGLYHAALEKEGQERLDFLQGSCSNEEVRREVESLLRHRSAGDKLLEQVPLAPASSPKLSAGSRLGPYEILSVIGSGGMGTVYAAFDSRLNRRVALKVALTAFDDRLLREARAIAALNHPRVCTIHDVGANYLVMELLDGETLASKLAREALAKRNAIGYACQIAEALGAAHSRGIVHRDLKPGNIMLTKLGVKVLDFGLAKFVQPPDEHDSTGPRTGDRALLGTLAFMSPEHLAGSECDGRSDIFSFGLVMYEMFANQRVSSDVRTAIREKRSVFAGPVSAPIERMINKCLAEDPDERWQSARDLQTYLEWLPKTAEAAPTRKTATAWWIVPAAVFAGLLLAAFWFTRAKTVPQPSHFLLSPPDGTRVALRMPTKSLINVSPDGRYFVVVVEDNSGERSLWLRALDSPNYQRIGQTEGASMAFWSPDSKFIGFFADEKLKKVAVSGGPPQTICEVGRGDGEGAAWGPDGSIVFAPPRPEAAALPVGALSYVPEAGGAVKPATSLLSEEGEISHSWPQFLPDGKHFLYLSRNKDPQNTRTIVQELGSSDRRTLITTRTQVTYAKGPNNLSYLLFPKDRALFAQPFDPSSLALSGEPVPVAAEVNYNTLYGTSAYSVSENGVLAYRSGNISAGTSTPRILAWYSRRGDRLGSVGEPGLYAQLALSPDQTRIAVDRNMKGNDARFWDIWIFDLAGGVFSRLTQGPSFRVPVWTPDSTRITAIESAEGTDRIVEIPARSDAAAGVVPLQTVSKLVPILESWSADGRYLFYTTSKAGSFWMPLFGARKPQPILSPAVYRGRSRLSPNGRWLAYHSSESGRSEVYVRSFPGLDQKVQISIAGGSQPLWSNDGKELYYLSLNSKLMAVDVTFTPVLTASTPIPLFQTTVEGNPQLAQYAASADGQRFLVMENARGGGESGVEQFHVVMNWFPR